MEFVKKTFLVMQCKVIHDICGSFQCSLKISKHYAKKLNFWLFSVFGDTLMKIHYRGKFHHNSICDCSVKLKVFKVLPIDSASTEWPFLESFWTLGSPNMVQYCQNSHERY